MPSCHRLIALILQVLGVMAALVAAPAHAAPTHIAATLRAEGPAAPGGTVTLAIAMRPDKGWHGYWSNPGDAGFGMTLAWALPPGASTAPLRYPVPHTLVVAGLMNHVYKDAYAVLVPLTLPANAAPGTRLPVRVHAAWLACTDRICVPERADLFAEVTIAQPGTTPPPDPQFDTWRARLPAPLGSPARFRIDGKVIRLGIPLPRTLKLDGPHIFAAEDKAIAYAAPQDFRRQGDLLVVTLARPGLAAADPPALSGVLRLNRAGDGVEFAARPGAVTPGGEPIEPAAAVPGPGNLALLLLGALAGGLLLNVMPCVFPIVSLKALSLARAGGNEAAAKREALAYTGGVMLTCVALGAVVLGLRAAGTQVGWAFQLQSPWIVFVLLLLATAITLNLAGAFELRAFGGGEALAGKGGVQGSFWTGVLAAFVATPCTGPFMAAALGAALVLPVAAALAVFAGLGLGLALPFLAIGFVPALRRMMPKPGAWMGKFQRFLSIPMALTVVALLWLVYQQQGNVVGDWALVTVAVIGVGAFWSRFRQPIGRPVVMAAIMGVMLAGGAAAIKVDRINGNAASADAGVPFSANKLAALRAEGKPVFLYFTADWCLTCKVNEKSAIDTRVAQAAFKAGGVTVMTGDWTNGDATITRFLGEQGASGVPLYLYYPKGGGEPQKLPQILTPGLLAGLPQS